MREIVIKSRFKKDFKKLESANKDLQELKDVIDILQSGGQLDATYHDHELKGVWKGKRDCHIQSDWLLIYELTDKELILYRTGSHSDLCE